ANFMNQKEIDAALQKSNESMMAQDRSYGVENPEPLYILGKNCCIQCDYGLGMETDETVRFITMMAGHPIKRVCYKEPESAIKGRSHRES
ncbi:unnamed protein product, partial [marine sediment metagenome]